MYYYEIIGVYRGEEEVIDETDTSDDAKYLVREYSIAFGSEWKICWKKRRK